MANPFEVARDARQQHLKEIRDGALSSEPQTQAAGLELAPKKQRGPVTLYMEKDLMEQVKRIAGQRGVSASALIEACVRKTLEDLE